MYTVYQHRNLKNGKSYVGMTSRKPNERWRSGKGYKNNLKMWNDIQNSDWNKDWKHNIIGQFEDKDEALNIEEMFIWLFDSTNDGYNTSTYGGTSYKRTEKTRKKMSESKIGNHNRPQTQVLQYSKDGKFIAEYPSIKEAEKQTGCYQENICNCCKGKRKSAGGFIWKYKEI